MQGLWSLVIPLNWKRVHARHQKAQIAEVQAYIDATEGEDRHEPLSRARQAGAPLGAVDEGRFRPLHEARDRTGGADPLRGHSPSVDPHAMGGR